MRRREFIALLGGAAVAWSSAASAQPAQQGPRVGYVWAGAPGSDHETLAGLRKGLDMPAVLLLTLLVFVLAARDVAAQDTPSTWRDPESGCVYLLFPQAGATLRYRRDGLPDCPGARSSLPEPPAYSGQDRELQQLTSRLRDVADGLRDLRRELERKR